MTSRPITSILRIDGSGGALPIKREVIQWHAYIKCWPSSIVKTTKCVRKIIKHKDRGKASIWEEDNLHHSQRKHEKEVFPNISDEEAADESRQTLIRLSSLRLHYVSCHQMIIDAAFIPPAATEEPLSRGFPASLPAAFPANKHLKHSQVFQSFCNDLTWAFISTVLCLSFKTFLKYKKNSRYADLLICFILS